MDFDPEETEENVIRVKTKLILHCENGYKKNYTMARKTREFNPNFLLNFDTYLLLKKNTEKFFKLFVNLKAIKKNIKSINN